MLSCLVCDDWFEWNVVWTIFDVVNLREQTVMSTVVSHLSWVLALLTNRDTVFHLIHIKIGFTHSISHLWSFPNFLSLSFSSLSRSCYFPPSYLVSFLLVCLQLFCMTMIIGLSQMSYDWTLRVSCGHKSSSWLMRVKNTSNISTGHKETVTDISLPFDKHYTYNTYIPAWMYDMSCIS